MSHVADQIDYLAIDAEWRKEWAKLMIPMTKRVGALRFHYDGTGTSEAYSAIYEDTLKLRAELQELKGRETSLLAKLEENRNAWHVAVSTRSGRLGELDTKVDEQEKHISSNRDAIIGLETSRHQLERSVIDLQNRISDAEISLRTTQDHEAALRQDFTENAKRSLSNREQKLQADISEWKLQVQKASDEHKEHVNQLQDTQKHQEERQLALVESEEILKTRQSNNEDESNKLKFARLVLQRLANGVGSTADKTYTLVDLDVLATSISNRFLNMQHAYAEKEKELADYVKFCFEIENKLEIATQQSRKLATSLGDRTKQLKVSEEKALSIPKKDLQIEQLQIELSEKKEKLNEQVQGISDYKEIKDLRQQIQDLQDTATSKDFHLNQVTQVLNSLHQTTSTEIRDLKSKATRDANQANQLREQLHSLQISSEAESTRLQQALDSERVAVTELSQEVKEQKRDLGQMERIPRDHVAAIAARDAELRQIKKTLEDTKRFTDSGMDQLESERDRAEEKVRQVKKTLRKREGQLLKIRDEWATVREENQRLKADTASRRQTTTGLQMLTRLQPRRPQDPSADPEDDINDASVSPQQDRRGITRVHGPADAPQRSGRKRKSSEMDSTEDGEPSESDRRSGRQNKTAVQPEASPQQAPLNSSSATWGIEDIRNEDYVPSPSIPAAILVKLRAKFGEWDRGTRDWTKPTPMRRCVEARCRRRKTEWPHGDNSRCGQCIAHNELCVVVEKDSRITLLPSYQEPENPHVAIDNARYWLS